jgi:hypothetical protein
MSLGCPFYLERVLRGATCTLHGAASVAASIQDGQVFRDRLSNLSDIELRTRPDLREALRDAGIDHDEVATASAPEVTGSTPAEGAVCSADGSSS